MKNTSQNLVKRISLPKKTTARLLVFSLLVVFGCTLSNCKKEYFRDLMQKGNTIRNKDSSNVGRDTSSHGKGDPGKDTSSTGGRRYVQPGHVTI
jgi:hypothetical protein